MPEVLYKQVDGVRVPLTDEEMAQREAIAAAFDLDFRFVRSERNGRLAMSDWTQAADSPLSDEKKAEWAAHRQDLRDYPSQADKVSELPDWPTPPE